MSSRAERTHPHPRWSATTEGGPADAAPGATAPGTRSRALARRAQLAALLSLTASLLPVALAVWLLPASAHVTDWSGGSVRRVLYVLSFESLVLPVGLGFAVIVAVALISIRRGVLPVVAATLSPLKILWLWAVPFVPGLSRWFPLTLLFGGPLRWAVAAAAVGGVCAMLLRGRLSGRALRPVGPRAVFLTSLAVYVGLGWYATSAGQPGGDEPHYLVITQSLVSDGDLRIENQHQERQYAAFHPGELPPHFLHRGIDGVIYSIHAPGTAAVVAPGYVMAGYRGAVLTLALLNAWTATLIFVMAQKVAGTRAAVWAWLGLAGSVALAPYGWLIYPEAVGALVAALAARWWWPGTPWTGGASLAAGLALSVLPWVHTKFVPLLAVFLTLLAMRCGLRWRWLITLATPIVVSLCLWFFSFYVMYGVADPIAPYGLSQQANLGNENIPRGLLGLLFDQEFGALLDTPVLLVAFVGMASLLGRTEDRRYALGLLAAVAALLFSVTRVYMWWGGWSTPARFLVPAVPLLAPFVAAGIARLRSQAGRGALTASVLFGLGALAVCAAEPEQLRLFNRRDGVGELVSLVQGPAPLWAALPSYLFPDWTSQLARTAAWVVAASAGLALHWRIGGRRAGQPAEAVWAVLRPLVAVAVLGTLAGSVAIPAAQGPEIVRQSRLKAMAAFDSGWLAPRDADSWRQLPLPALRRQLALDILPNDHLPREPERIILANGLDLPPGRYELRVWLDGTEAATGRMSVWYHNILGFVASRQGSLSNPAVLPFTLPVSLPDLWFGVGGGFPVDRVQRIELAPLDLVPRADRMEEQFREVLGLDAPMGVFILYLDRQVYVEGHSAWVRGGLTTSFLVTGPAAGASVEAVLINGATPQEVTLAAGSRIERWSLGASETRPITLTLPAGVTRLPVSITSPSGFRPSEVDSTSRDDRWLGVRLTFVRASAL